MKMRAGTVSCTSVYLDIRKCVGHCTLNKSQDEKAAVEAGTVTFENMLWEITGLLPPTIVSGMFPSHTRRRPPPCGDRGKVRQNEWKEDFTDTKEGITFFAVLQKVPPGAHKTFKNHNKKMSKISKIYNTWYHLFFFCVCFFVVAEIHYSLFRTKPERTWYFRASLHLFTCLLHLNMLQIFRSDKKREPLLFVLGVRQLDGQQIKTLKRISGNKAVASKDAPGLNFSTVFPWRVTRMWAWNISSFCNWISIRVTHFCYRWDICAWNMEAFDYWTQHSSRSPYTH